MLCASFVLAALMLGGCGGGFRTSGHDVAMIIGSAPDDHAGELHAFAGRVVDAYQHAGGYEIQLSIATVSPTFVVNYPVRDALDVHPDDYVCVLGRVAGGGAGINGLGGYQRAVLMDGVAVRGERSSEWVLRDVATYEAWRAGTLQLGSRLEAPMAASVVGTGR